MQKLNELGAREAAQRLAARDISAEQMARAIAVAEWLQPVLA